MDSVAVQGQQLGQLVKTLNSRGVPLRDRQSYLVFQQVNAAAGHQHVQTVGVFLRILGQSSVQSVHLGGRRGDEQITLRPLLDLRQQGPGGAEVEGQRHIGRCILVKICNLRQSLRHGCGGKHHQFHRLRFPALRFFLRGSLLRLLSAGRQGQRQRECQHQRTNFFHHIRSSFPCQFIRGFLPRDRVILV